MEKVNTNNTNNNNENSLNKLYDNLSYFDNYGSSVMLVILITLILILLISFSFALIYRRTIANNWTVNRCKLSIIPFAGFINKPDNMSIQEYTKQNFDFCVQDNIKNSSGFALQPLEFITNSLSSMVAFIIEQLNSIRAMFDKIRNMSSAIAKEIYGRLINFIIPLQQIIISIKDAFAKIQGTLVAVLYTFLGSYYGLQSLMGYIAQALIKILIALAAIILVLWITPFTWGTAAAGTVLLIAVSVPLVLFLTFLKDAFGINIKSPKVPSAKQLKCFDKNTVLEMNDGTEKKIIDICPGDVLKNNNKVTACFKVKSKGSIMYVLNGVTVSDSHLVQNNCGKWVRVSEHELARKIAYYDYNDNCYLYCLNTETKIINIKNIIFSDWDEIYDIKMISILDKLNNFCLTNDIIIDKKLESKDIHKYLENGFSSNTNVKLLCGKIKKIYEVEVGDILEGGEKVYGVVKINGADINQYCYNFGKYKFEGGPNLVVSDESMFITSTVDLDKNDKNEKNVREKTLYNLLTDENTFIVNNIQFYDYNSSIDFF